MTDLTGEMASQLAGALQTAEAEPGFPAAYVARVRAAVQRLDPLPSGTLDVEQAMTLVTQQARIDVDVPLRSQRPAAKLAKVAIKRATAWYLRYVADQVGDLGQALVQLGGALAHRVDGLSAQLGEATSATEQELADLRRRIAALEEGAGERRARTFKAEGRPRP